MEDIRPTAKWANRMLRPLTSIYHRLEKHNEIVTSVLISKTKEREKERIEAAIATDPDHQTWTRLSIPRNGAEKGCSYSDDEEPNDPAWIPGKIMDRRRIRHNYGSRGQRGQGIRRRSRLLIRSPEVPKTLPGAIEIATPLITGKMQGGPGAGSLAGESPSLRMQLFQNHAAGASAGSVDVHQGMGCPAEGRGKRGRTNNSSFRPYQGSWKEVLDHSGDPGLVDAAHLLDRIFLKFLANTRVTTPTSDGGPRGARSLLSTAVRRIPEFIAGEQREQDALEEDCDVDMCDAYFTELEANYAPGENGWQPLREAVRAQGIYLVSCMIQNRWITSLAACRLLKDCLFAEELDAFESLETKVLASMDAYRYPTTFDPPRASEHMADPIRILSMYYVRHPARHAYVSGQLTMLLTRGVLHPEWMVTTVWKKCVDKAIKSVSTEDRGYAAGRQLIEAVILSAAGIQSRLSAESLSTNRKQTPRPIRARETRHTSSPMNDQSACPVPIQDALSNLVSSLITALCGMCIARSQAADVDERSAGLKTREMVNYLAFTVQRVVGDETATAEEPSTFHPLRRGYVLLADCALECGKSVTPEIVYHTESVSRRNIESFFRESATRQDVVRELARLVSQVFHYSGHAQDQGPVRTPREIRARISQLAQLTSISGVAVLLGQVAAEAAMELAEKSADPDDHTWAVEIQETVASSQEESESPSSSQLSTSLYRWEDSIGEWVARTPAPRPRALNSAVAARPQVKGRGRPRNTIPCSTSSSDASSTCSEESMSSVTSSAPSVSRKRPNASQDPSPRPFKRSYFTRSAEREESEEDDSANEPDRSPAQSLSDSGAFHVPVAARTRTGLRDVLQKNPVGQGGAGSSSRGENPVGLGSTFEVVIVNKSPGQNQEAEAEAEEEPAVPISTPHRNRVRPGRPRGRLARRSVFQPRKSPRLVRRRQSAPVQVTRRRTVIPCSQDDDSDDELSFL